MAQTQQATTEVRLVRDEGQIRIPAEFRRALGIEDGTLVRMTLLDSELRLQPLTPEEAATVGSPWLKEL